MVAFELNVSNDMRQIITVTDQNLRFPGNEQDVKPFSVYRNCSPIPLLRLGPRQRIHVRGVALKGQGRVHAKWSPVCAVPFRPHVQLNCDRVKVLFDDEYCAPQTA